MWWFLGLFGVCLIGWGIFSTYWLLYPERLVFPTPTPLPSYTSHSIVGRDGSCMEVWLLEAPRPKGRLLICHGYYANRCQVLELADGLRRLGYEALLIELRGHGQRPGPCTLGVRERHDAQDALDWAAHRPGAAALPLGVLGFSMGAMVASHVAAEYPGIKAVVTDSLYSRLFPAIQHAFQQRYHVPAIPWVWLTWVGLHVALRTRLASYDPVVIASRLRQPLLTIHGGKDQRVIPAWGEAFYQAWAGPKEQWLDPDVAHVKMFLSHPEPYCRRVAEFFDRALTAQ